MLFGPKIPFKYIIGIFLLGVVPVCIVVQSVGRGLYNCWGRHMADSDPALLPPAARHCTAQSPGPLQPPAVYLLHQNKGLGCVGGAISQHGWGQWSSAPGEGLGEFPFQLLQLPTCNLEAQGLDFYYGFSID